MRNQRNKTCSEQPTQIQIQESREIKERKQVLRNQIKFKGGLEKYKKRTMDFMKIVGEQSEAYLWQSI